MACCSQYWATPANDVEPNQPTTYPRHYLEQFHPKYNAEAEARAKAGGAESWVQNFHSKADAWRNPDIPRLNPWIVTQGIGQGDGAKVIAKRNPYYFKVDPEGNQLPYIDEVTVDIISTRRSPCSRQRTAISTWSTAMSASSPRPRTRVPSSITRRRAATTSTRCCPTAPT